MRFALCVALLVAALAGLASGQVCILSGLKETYFEGRNFTGSALHTGMGVPFRNWGFNSPVPGVVPKNNFAVRWQGDITPPTTGDYRFRFGSDDGYRLYINGVLHCSAWIVRFFRTTTECRPISFNGGQKYAIMIEFFEQFETARIEGAWILPGDTLPTRIPDSAYSYDNCTAPEIVVNPAPVQINSATEQATVNVHLAVRPSSDVKVTLESDCMYFEVCDLTFTPLNYNTPVPVKAVMKASFTDNCCPIRAVGTGGDLNYLGVFKNFTACRIDAKTSTAISFGDPHMTTFDGVHYDFFNVGDYYLVRHVSGQFAVQTRQGPCASVSCNFGVAVKYRSSVVTVFVASATGAPQLIITGNPAGEGVSLQVTSSRYIVTTPNGIVTYINIGHWTAKNLYYISVKVVSGPANAGLLYGLAGKYDGNPANDWTTSGGVLTTVKNTFANSWLVPQAQNLFADPAATIPAILGGSTAPTGSFVPQPCSKTPEVPPVPLCQANCSVPDPAPTPCTTNCVEPNCKVYPNATFEAQAKASCGQWFNDSTASCCAQYLSGNPFYETCLCDYVLTQSDAFNLDHVDAFYQACASAASKVGGSCDLCPKACSGHGVCSNGKCACVSGYSGDDCGHKEDDNPTVDPVAATPGKYCNTSLTITGTGFYGTLSCRFSNNLGVSVTTPATATSAFSLTCLLPTVQGSLGATLNLEVVRLTGSYTATSAPATITLKDSCCKNPCLNGGACSEVADGILCDCPVPFSGALCGNAGCSSSSAYGGTVGPSKNNFEDAVTCPVGKILRATTPCTAGGSYGSESVTCVTISGSCPAQAFANAYFPKTAAGASALGQCDPGYSGTPLRNCDEAGSWSSSLSGSCELIFCPSVTEDGITWPQTFAGSFYATTCSGDLVGAPSRICNPDGTWALISNPCVSSVNCPPDNYAHASWPATSFNATATGLCDAGYAGTPKRFCQENGSWSVSVFNACQRQSCAPLDDGSAMYPGTLSGDISIGTCKQGLVGTPARKCQLDLKWGPEFGGSCV